MSKISMLFFAACLMVSSGNVFAKGQPVAAKIAPTSTAEAGLKEHGISRALPAGPLIAQAAREAKKNTKGHGMEAPSSARAWCVASNGSGNGYDNTGSGWPCAIGYAHVSW